MGQKNYPIVNNFSKGELSSRMEGRVDIQGYYQGCKIMENCIMVAQGGAEKRPGTVYLGKVYEPPSLGDNAQTRLIPFEVSDEEIYILEVGHLYIKVWNVLTKAVVSDPEGKGVDIIKTEYTGDDISKIQYAQTEGTIYFAHEKYAIRQIEKNSADFKFISLGTEVRSYDATYANYVRGDVVAYLGNYFKAQRSLPAATTPVISDWEKVGSVPSGFSGTKIPWVSGVYGLNAYVVHNEILWICVKATTGTEEPGQPSPVTETTEVKVLIEFSTVISAGYNVYSGELIQYLDANYGVGVWKITGFKSSPFGLPVGVRITYDKITFINEYYWEDTGIGLPNVLDNLFSWAAGSYDQNDYAYDPTTFELYRAMKTTSAVLADGRNWDQLDTNPLFNSPGDYPSAIAFMGDRLILGGTLNKPQTMIASRINDYRNFSLGTDDDDAYSFTIAADRSSRIKWIVAKDVLMIGTSSSEWLVSGGASGITPSNVQVLRQSAYGSAYQQALFVADTLLFFQKGGRKLREYIYSNDNKAYLANDLTFFADHITENGLIESTYQQNPDSILWTIKEDGTLIGLTYDRLNQIAGWHRHSTDGLFESVASVDGAGDEDELWFIVKRNVNGNTERYIEYMNPRNYGEQRDAVFVDSAYTQKIGAEFAITSINWTAPKITVTFVGTADFANTDHIKIKFSNTDNIDGVVFEVNGLSGQTFDLYDPKTSAYYTTAEFDDPNTGTMGKVTDTIDTGIDYLEGKTVSILGDGAVFPDQEVVSGEITLQSECNVITVGLPYIMRLQPESIELPGSATLTAKRRISSVILKLYETLGGKAGPDENSLEEMRFRSTTVPFGSPPPLFTGAKQVSFDSSSEREASVLVYHDQPLPITVLAIVSDLSYSR
ncbi:hypothetical protein KAR91_69995 [Candidatus Pacearchaeota archaeon]|nr:hypothetical protein [Candidatus Pacearchaeota archaeon]